MLEECRQKKEKVPHFFQSITHLWQCLLLNYIPHPNSLVKFVREILKFGGEGKVRKGSRG